MRYLVGFLMALAVLAFGACGGGECAEPSDIADVWEFTATAISDGCRADFVSYTFPMTIVQDGKALSGETPPGTLTGTVCGDRIEMSGVVPGPYRTRTANLQLTISADGNSMEGSDTWTWTHGVESCVGSESLRGARVGNDVCDWGFGCPCLFSLDRYCTVSSCPTYEQALAAAENRAVQFGCGYICEGSSGSYYGAGRCGDLRWVETDCGVEHIEYFDASGTLVAARFLTDDCGSVCPGSCSTYYGFRPECEREEEQNFCDQND